MEPDVKPDDLSSNLETHMLKGEKWILQSMSPDLHVCHGIFNIAHIHSYIYTHTQNKQKYTQTVFKGHSSALCSQFALLRKMNIAGEGEWNG